MEKQLSRGIKDVITQHPQVGRILDEFNVGCTTCGVGTCLLKDVVGIHNLNPETEIDLMYQIEKAIYPDREMVKPQIDPAKLQKTVELKYSPPVKTLVDEHVVIKRWLALIPKVVAALDNQPDDAWQWIEQGVALIQNYADRYHHAKEEDILFKYVDESMEIIQVMHEEHVMGRNHRKAVSEAIKTQDKVKAATHLLAFRELLTQHIKKEDEILYPWIDRALSDNQVGEMFAKFAETDANSTDDPQKYIDFVEALEERLA
jgi:hemerythrin-like domain-containing protein